MSFRGDGQQRYGHVPPVQYPVSGQPNAYQQPNNVGRRPSFNSGDDGAYHGQQAPHRPSPYGNRPSSNEQHDELFLSSPTAQSGYNRPAAFSSANSALSGFQHQYQDPTAPTTQQQSTYNPQSFATSSTPYQRTHSTSLSYRPAPSPQYASTATFPQQPQTSYTHQAYNPAAYASPRQPTFAGFTNTSDPHYAVSSPSHVPAVYSHGQSPGATYTPTFPVPNRTNTYGTNYQQQPQQQPQPHVTTASSGSTMNPQTPSTTYNPSQWPNTNTQYAPSYSNGNSPGRSYSQAPYPTTSHIPVGPNYSADNTSYPNRESRSNSQVSPTGSPASHSPAPTGGLQRHPTNAPLPSRPMEDAHEGRSWGAPTLPPQDDFGHDQALLMEDIEAELGALASGGRQRSSASRSPINGRYSQGQDGHIRTHSSASSNAAYGNRPGSHRGSANAPALPSPSEEDDDDPEGTAGVMAMRQAELDDRRFSGTTFAFTEASSVHSSHLPTPAEEQSHSSDSDFGGAMDLGMFSGGYAGGLAYGHSPPATSSTQESGRPLPSPNYQQQSYGHAPAYNHAQMDYGGTGGLQPPSAARLSFDEGDERVSIHSQPSGTESPTKDEYQDLFYHPGLTNRPLPSVPPTPASDSSTMVSSNDGLSIHHHSYSTSNDARFHQPQGLETYHNNNNSSYSPQPERSISLSGHTTTPQVQAPIRSRTDAAEERRKAGRYLQPSTTQTATLPEYDTPQVGAFDGITLPTGRKRRFVPSKLSQGDLRRCAEPWALSSIEAWIREMADGEPDLKQKTIDEALIYLFTFKVPTMNVADAEALSSRVVSLMLESGTLLPEEEWVKFGQGHISGVLWQLTGSGCYAPKLHEYESTGRCYSYHCTRTLKKVDLNDLDAAKPTDEWHVFYGLKKDDLDSRPKKEVERQNILHEIVTGEENYVQQLDLFRTMYRDDLRTRRPPILQPEKQDKFLAAVFGKLDVVVSINKENLLAQLKYRQQEQGPWITGFSDLFREWIRKAKSDYIEYAMAYPRATFMVRKEADRNVLFKRFLDEKQRDPRSKKQDWTHFLITPLQRLQRYILLLESIDHKMQKESEEKTNLQKAIDEIKSVTHECDAKVADTNKRVAMMELDRKLVLRPGFQSILNLDRPERQLVHKGDLTRLGSKGVRWVDMHAILFDHYLILAKEVSTRDGREKKYDVSKEPIPMPLLFLESVNDEPIQRQKGITAPLARTATASASSTQLNKVTSNGSGRPVLEHSATGSTISGSLTPTVEEGRILFPFRVKHLGHEVYVLYANSARDRETWCNHLIEAKTNHARALISQNAEPFRLRVLADAAFAYDSSSVYARAASVPVRGTPLDKAISDLEGVLGQAQGIAPICRSQVNCATAFTAFGKSIIAIGTDYGIFISDPSNPRGWTRVSTLVSSASLLAY